MLEKISSEQVDGVMLKAAATLRAQEARISELEGLLQSLDRKQYAEKIASKAVSQGIVAVEEEDSYAEELASGQDDLKLVEDFVGRSAAGIPLGMALEKGASENDSSEIGSDVLTTFLLSSDYAG